MSEVAIIEETASLEDCLDDSQAIDHFISCKLQIGRQFVGSLAERGRVDAVVPVQVNKKSLTKFNCISCILRSQI
jgi:hypothetical protein